jgi:hypothetical protein
MKYYSVKDIVHLRKLLSKSWEKETCSPNLRRKWSKKRKYVGQSDVTSLVVNELFGGEIMHYKNGNDNYYYNVLDGLNIDLSLAADFQTVVGEEISREVMLEDKDMNQRYQKLRKNIAYNVELEQNMAVQEIVDEFNERDKSHRKFLKKSRRWRHPYV